MNNPPPLPPVKKPQTVKEEWQEVLDKCTRDKKYAEVTRQTMAISEEIQDLIVDYVKKKLETL